MPWLNEANDFMNEVCLFSLGGSQHVEDAGQDKRILAIEHTNLQIYTILMSCFLCCNMLSFVKGCN
jgi:hypothetical protein